MQRGETGTLEVVEAGRPLTFSFDDVLRFHGGGSPGGAALGFQALQRALALLAAGDGPCERRAIAIATAFGGPGARDAFELVTRAVTDGRFVLDPALARPERGSVLERFVFRIGVGTHAVTLVLREGFVTEEFIDLARADERSVDQEQRLTLLKRQLAERVMARPATAVYDAEGHGA
jgi:hypothetical protein